MADDGIGAGPRGSGTPRPTDDVGVGGVANFGGVGDLGGTQSMRTGNAGTAGILGSRTGDVPPATGLDTGRTEAATDALPGEDAIPRRSASAGGGGETLAERGRAHGAEQPSPMGTAGVSTGVAGVPTGEMLTGQGDPGAADLGAAVGDAGAGLGETRGDALDAARTRGQVTPSGGTRGSGAGTGHLEDTA